MFYRVGIEASYMKKEDLPELLETTISNLGGRGTIVEICKAFWAENEKEL